MKNEIIKIQINIGTIIMKSRQKKIYTGRCQFCGKLVHYITITKRKKLIVEKIGNTFVSHFLHCPYKRKKYDNKNTKIK